MSVNIYYKYLKYKNKYLNLIGGAAAAENIGEKLSNIAIGWIGKGTYVIGDEYIVSNPLGGFLMNYFMILFADWGNIFGDNLHGIKELAREKYKDKTLSFNCWQFVLLCMMESGLITEENIKNFYMFVMNSAEKRVPLYFMEDEKELLPYDDKINLGDIILEKNSENVIHHAGIYTGENMVTETFFYPVSKLRINNSDKNYYYIKYEIVARNIINIMDRNLILKPYKIPEEKFIRIGIVNYYKKNIDKILEELFESSIYSKFKDYAIKIEYLKTEPIHPNYEESLEFGAPIDRLVKQKFFNLHRLDVENKVLMENNIIFEDKDKKI